MTVVSALLNSSEDISLYSPIRSFSNLITGTGSFSTLLNVSGKGGLLGCKISAGNSLTAEIRITIDGAVWSWTSHPLNSGYVGGIVDIEEVGFSNYLRNPSSVRIGSSMLGSFLASPNPGATSAVTSVSALLIREPILFNSSILIEAKWNSGVSMSSAIFGYYK